MLSVVVATHTEKKKEEPRKWKTFFFDFLIRTVHYVDLIKQIKRNLPCTLKQPFYSISANVLFSLYILNSGRGLLLILVNWSKLKLSLLFVSYSLYF